jgi:hypothetical protein
VCTKITSFTLNIDAYFYSRALTNHMCKQTVIIVMTLEAIVEYDDVSKKSYCMLLLRQEETGNILAYVKLVEKEFG